MENQEKGESLNPRKNIRITFGEKMGGTRGGCGKKDSEFNGKKPCTV